jgi:hypothetical protein
MIIEPFAGSAGYATGYPDREVVLVERAPHIAALWRWLISASVDEVDPYSSAGAPDLALPPAQTCLLRAGWNRGGP